MVTATHKNGACARVGTKIKDLQQNAATDEYGWTQTKMTGGVVEEIGRAVNGGVSLLADKRADVLATMRRRRRRLGW